MQENQPLQNQESEHREKAERDLLFHELRTPLTIVMLEMENLRDSLQNEARMLDRIHECLKLLIGRIDTLARVATKETARSYADVPETVRSDITESDVK